MDPFPKTTFPERDSPLRLAMIGMVPGNGHPYSWSSIINGYDDEELVKCPYPTVAEYLKQQGTESTGIERAEVTHVWTDDPNDAPRVAALARIGNILLRPEDAIGQVDAVIVATDDGDNHVARARPFVEADLPVFIDKPLATNLGELNTFSSWQKAGHFVMSSSGLRYAPELRHLKARLHQIGGVRWASCTTAKKWETYGIHALECLFQIVGPGFLNIRIESYNKCMLIRMEHEKGMTLSIPVLEDGYGSFAAMQVCGTDGLLCVQVKDTYAAFRNLLQSFIDAVKTRCIPISFEENLELMCVIIAGRTSLKDKSRIVNISECMEFLQ